MRAVVELQTEGCELAWVITDDQKILDQVMHNIQWCRPKGSNELKPTNRTARVVDYNEWHKGPVEDVFDPTTLPSMFEILRDMPKSATTWYRDGNTIKYK